MLRSVLALGAVLTFAGTAWADITVEHVQGTTVLPEKPTTIVVFDVAALDTLDALGVQVSGVAKSPLPDYLAQYGSDDYIKTGSLFEPDYETVAAMQPDLVIVGGRSSSKYSELAKIAPTIDLTVESTQVVADLKRNLEIYGEVFGLEETVQHQAAELDKAIAALNEVSDEAGPVLALVTTGGRISAHGTKGRFGVLYNEFGLTPAHEVQKAGRHGQPVSHEFIAANNPDYIFVLDRDAAIGKDGQPAKALLDSALVRGTTAWENHNVVFLDPVRWYVVGGGLEATKRNAQTVVEVLTK